MKMSIVVVNWNTGDLLYQCLDFIADNMKAWSIEDTETFIVDNASQDDSLALARSEHPWA